MSLWARLSGPTQSEERSAAIRRGLAIVEEVRAAPFFDRANRLTLERHRCVGYALPRTTPASPAGWAFLQRDESSGAQYPSGWMFQSAGGAATPWLDTVLRAIADTWTEEFLEFEADRGRIVAFWGEWGGSQRVEQIDGWSRALDASTSAA
jgi:hypothetical protein